MKAWSRLHTESKVYWDKLEADCKFDHLAYITITNSSATTLTDVPIRLILDNSIDARDSYQCGDDIIFYTQDNKWIPHWVEIWDKEYSYLRVWVKVPSIPANGATTIKMLYGNRYVKPVGSGDKVFPIFHEFLLYNIWTDYNRSTGLKRIPGGNEDQLGNPCVIKVGDTYHMYYSAYGADGKGRVAHAISRDGFNWKRLGIALDVYGAVTKVVAPTVVYKDGKFYMWVQNETDGTIDFAYSYDGHNFEPYGAVLTAADAPGGLGIDSLWQPSAIWDEEKEQFVLACQAFDNDTPQGYMCIFYSDDGINWTGDPNNPVFTKSQTWEDYAQGHPILFKTRGMYVIYYAGRTSDDNKLGLAYSRDCSIWYKFANNPIVDHDVGVKGWSRSVEGPHVFYIEENDTWIMYFENEIPGGNMEIGLLKLRENDALYTAIARNTLTDYFTFANAAQWSVPRCNLKVLGSITAKEYAVLKDYTVDSDYIIEYAMYERVAQNSGGICFGFQDADNYYFTRANMDEDYMLIKKMSGGAVSDINSAAVVLDFDTWYRCKVRWNPATGAINFEIFDYINNASIGSISGTDTTFTSGKIGFHTDLIGNNGETYFSYLLAYPYYDEASVDIIVTAMW